ncbi:MAG TPA: 30S ribosomal protein S4e [Candidatus Acidoferrales bacterium]|nr:30S ribosomal protein S4e [Candidatus Acidoferrales bacterium]
MGKKGKTARLKRKPAPAFWPIHRKDLPWVVKPQSGSHSLETCLPMTLVLRDILGVAQTRKEGKLILAQGKVLVDGKIRKRDDSPVGLMDVISMPEMDKYYRIMPSKHGLVLASISKEESNFKLVRVEDKTTVTNGVQVALHDGSIMLVKVADPKNPVEVTYNTFDVLKVTYPEKQVTQTLSVKEGNLAIITGGKNIGKTGKIVEIEKTEAKKRRQALVVVEDAKGARYQTIMDYVFSIGEAAPMINTLEALTVE